MATIKVLEPVEKIVESHANVKFAFRVEGS